MLKFSKLLLSRPLSIPLIVLLLVITGRLMTLELVDLLDPSETRYAFIAAYMQKTHNWLTPQIVTPVGLTPFLSKPPLHYWLVALCYQLLGIDEWTSRLPSFFGYVLILGCSYSVAAQLAGRSAGLLAVLLCSISPLLYFVAGGTTVDVTFSAFVALALTAFFWTQQSSQSLARAGWLFFAAMAAAFMVKGPLALVLIGLPIFGHCLYLRNCGCLRRLPLISGAAIFCALVLPWFVSLEIVHPGSIRYFVWNENVLRYLSTDYGDRYGDGHEHIHGTIVLFFIVANLLPFLIALGAVRTSKHQGGRLASPWTAFLLLWTLGPVLFFTMARNILPSYILPSCAGSSILLALFVRRRLPERADVGLMWVSKSVGLLSVVYLAITVVAGHSLSYTKSAKAVLRQVVTHSPDASGDVPTVGVWGTDNLSPFWLSLAGKDEIGDSLKVEFVSEEKESQSCCSDHFTNILVRAQANGQETFSATHPDFRLQAKYGRWLWFMREARGVCGLPV